MNRSVQDAGGDVLAVSQFTCLPPHARAIGRRTRPRHDPKSPGRVRRVRRRARATAGQAVPTGVFGAMMQVELVNDGPVTILLDSRAESDGVVIDVTDRLSRSGIIGATPARGRPCRHGPVPHSSPRLAVAVVLAVVVATGWFLYTRNIPLVEVAPVRSGRLAQTVVVSGRVLAPAKVDIGATITGRVLRVAVDDGAKVAANALLIELERSELEAALAQARATERAAQTRIAQWREVAAPNARELVTQAEANLRVAERDLARQEDLVGRKFVAEARVDEARRAVEVARSQVATARSTAAANRPEGAERQLLEDQLAQSRAARIAAEAKLDQTRILAPANGVVLDRAVEPGDIVQPAKRLMTIALDGATRLTALIDEKNLGVLTIASGRSPRPTRSRASVSRRCSSTSPPGSMRSAARWRPSSRWRSPRHSCART